MSKKVPYNPQWRPRVMGECAANGDAMKIGDGYYLITNNEPYADSCKAGIVYTLHPVDPAVLTKRWVTTLPRWVEAKIIKGDWQFEDYDFAAGVWTLTSPEGKLVDFPDVAEDLPTCFSHATGYFTELHVPAQRAE